jgi:two-component system cell cycle response regulator
MDCKDGIDFPDGSEQVQHYIESKVAERTREFKQAIERLEALSTTDPLTGMANHRGIIAVLDGEIERCRQFGRTCAVVFMDIDHFKAINESYGHEIGDRALAELRSIVGDTLRGIDTIGRWGGEEFLIVLPEVDSSAAVETAERIRAAIALYAFDTGSPSAIPRMSRSAETKASTFLTCSLGVAVYPQDAASRSELIQAADRAMYGAKRLGRNQVRSATDPVIAVLDEPADTREAEIVQGVVEALAMLVAARDCYTGRHTTEVAEFAERIAVAMGLSAPEAHVVSLVGQLHDIGKVAIPDSVLKKPDELNGEEWAQMRQHTVVGADVVSRMPTLSTIARAIRAHHERWDGQGYPDGLAGEDIPLASRIVSVADTFGAITSDRPYRKAKSVEWALEELRRCAGKQFDPDVVAAAERVLAERPMVLDAAA